MTAGWVYFLRPVGAAGPVKIGYSAAPRERLDVYLHWSPFPLEIAARIPGLKHLEGRFHALFEAHHSHHEWFYAHPEITAVVDAIRDGTFDPAILPAKGSRLERTRRRVWTPEARLATRLRHAVERLQKAGMQVPSAVDQASQRYALWGSAYGPVARTAEDAAAVHSFIAPHLSAKRMAEIVGLARECGLDRIAA